MPSPHRNQRLTMPSPEEYFKGVSPLCRRILEDMAKVRENYGNTWEQLSYDEQCKILDQTIVDEATVRRYETANLIGPDCEYFPKLKLCTGQKIVSDEKLSARGYSCSWRDEHSSPFSWHSRSQMDLTLDILPDTYLQNSASPMGDGDVSKQGYAWSSLRTPLQTVRPAPFFWHYAPQHDLKPPDPPDLVLASLNCNDTNATSQMLPREANFNHVVVRAPGDDKDSSGFLSWFRGAFSAITSTCIPLHPCGNTQRSMLYPGNPFIHPELRPPHVIAKAAKISLPTVTQPKRPTTTDSEDSIFRMPRDATVKSECSSTETETTFATDVASDMGSHAPSEDDKVSKRDSQNLNRNLLCNRNSVMYGTFAEEEEDSSRRQITQWEASNTSPSQDCVIDTPRMDNGVTHRDEDNNPSGYDATFTAHKDQFVTHRSKLSDSYELEDDMPLINLSTNNQSLIPKTGFDFLDNW